MSADDLLVVIEVARRTAWRHGFGVDAEDIAHDAVVRAMTARFTANVPNAIVRWAKTIAMNLIRDRVRRLGLRRRLESYASFTLQNGLYQDRHLQARRWQRNRRLDKKRQSGKSDVGGVAVTPGTAEPQGEA